MQKALYFGSGTIDSLTLVLPDNQVKTVRVVYMPGTDYVIHASDGSSSIDAIANAQRARAAAHLASIGWKPPSRFDGRRLRNRDFATSINIGRHYVETYSGGLRRGANQRHRFALRRKRLVFHGLSTFSLGLTLQPTASVHKRIMVFIAQN